MISPVRVQLSRRKGWQMPANTVKVDRTTRWGNPFKVWPTADAAALTATHAVALFRELNALLPPEKLAQLRTALRGKNLACWCRDGAPCHADVLLELANAEPVES